MDCSEPGVWETADYSGGELAADLRMDGAGPPVATRIFWARGAGSPTLIQPIASVAVRNVHYKLEENFPAVRPISWLHVSDVHLRPRDAWEQDLVLRAMCDDIRSRRDTCAADFVLLSGDLAFSGKSAEYEIAAAFLDALSEACGVPTARIYCVPGNHDVDRDRQRMAFIGARATLCDQNRTDAFLAPSSHEELQTLLRREEGYRTFQASYFADQERMPTDDGLAYVAHLAIEDVRLAIVALDSTWLAEGGIGDHGRLLIGERQIVNALRLAQEDGESPHVVLAMSHHPLHILQEFDRRPAQARIERNCQFLHCGHLHDPEQKPAGDGPHACLTLTAGASFDTRHTRNNYSIVTLDLLRAVRVVTTIQYDPHNAAFTATTPHEFPIEIQPTDNCSVGELATVIATDPASASWSHYLAALLLDQKAEIPIPTDTGFTLGSFALLKSGPDSEYKTRSAAFTAFRNALRVLYPRVPLARIFDLHGEVVAAYGATLGTLTRTHRELATRLDALEGDARALAAIESSESVPHAIAMLNQIATTGDWPFLREQAERHVGSPSQSTATKALHMLALASAHGGERGDKQTAVLLYRELDEREVLDPTEFAIFATLLLELGDPESAQDVILRGVAASNGRATGQLVDVGHRVIEATGDREFREKLNTAIAAREIP